MAKHFDDQQLEAIQTTGTSILVSASAGAGKTGVLVERLMKRCVTDRIPLQNILAVTFTKAAAQEMKKRLAINLHEKLHETSDPELTKYLNEQLIALDVANITTIDAYCLTIIQKYYSMIGLDPATASHQLSSGVGEMMKKQAFEDVYQELYLKDHECAIHLASMFSSNSDDYDSLYSALNQINSCANAAMNPDEWYQQARDLYPPIKRIVDAPIAIQDSFYSYLQLKLESLLDDLNTMDFYGSEIEKYDASLTEAKRIRVENCLSQVKDHAYENYRSSLQELALQKTSAGTKYPSYKTTRDGLNRKITSLLDVAYDESTLVKATNDTAKWMLQLIDLAQAFRNRFLEEKRKNACMDFEDMERLALQILEAHDGAVAKVIQDSLKEIMIDEFQDTSELQNEIISHIAQVDNVFRVGDVKQSIYRFRQAKPSLMRSLMQSKENKLICLEHNYRSLKSVVDFTNVLFTKIMNVPNARDTYGPADQVTIGRPEQEEVAPPITFVRLEPLEDEEEDIGDKTRKAEWIAQAIAKRKLEDPSCRFRDFAILTRNHGDMAFLRTAFEKVGIPYDIDAREGFYQSVLCQTILAICSAVNNPMDNLSLVAVLTSSFYRFTDEQLAQLKIHHKTVYEGIKEEYPHILEELHELRMIGEQDGILQLLSEIANRHNFFHSLDARQQANFDNLFQKTISAESYALNDFIHTMEASLDEKSSEAMAKGKDDDVVTVTTIHHSKGLQYKIVYLWSSCENRFTDGSSALLVDPDLGIAMKDLVFPYHLKLPTIHRFALEYKVNIEDLEEFTRLLYVAITRAEKELYIVDVMKKEYTHCKPTLSLLNARGGMSSLILSVLNESNVFSIISAVDTKKVTLPEPISTTVDALPTFKLQVPKLAHIATPSSTEMKDLPELDLQRKKHGTSYGTLMHEIASELPNRMWTLEDLEDTPLRPTDKENLLSFCKSPVYQRSLQGKIHKEYPFYIENERYRCNGTMDFISILENEIILVDFKTDSTTLEEIQKRYSEQLNTYRKALEILYPNKIVYAYAYSFHNQKEVEITRDDKKLS